MGKDWEQAFSNMQGAVQHSLLGEGGGVTLGIKLWS